MISVCESCGGEYNRAERRNRPGRAVVCNECAEEEAEVVRYTGVPIYGHKTAATLQINRDPRLTQYILNATKLKQKGSNMTDNVNQCAKYAQMSRTEGACLTTADCADYKNRGGI